MKKIFVFISLLLSFASSTYADDAFSVDNVTLPKNEAADYWKEFKEIKEILPEGSTFTALTEEGVEMTFKVISESEKTCMVGIEEYGVASITETYNGGITIPSVVNGYTVTTIGDFAFCHCESLTSISIPSSVTSIGNKAFTDCSSLTSINIPSSVTYIGNNTFNACSSLTSIVVEEGNERYDSRDNCNAIIETATNKLVRGCLNTVIPNSVTSIGDSAFEGIPGLTSIEIPNRVTCIEGEAFCGTGLTSIDIPSSVTSIGHRAFYHTGLSSITIPSSVENFNGGALTGCTELTSIIVESGNPVYDCRDNCNAIVESSTNTLIAGCKNTIIPNTVTRIGSEAFYDHNEITTIAIPSSVTSLGDQAFRGSGLTSINIPEGVTNIESWAFVECHDLTSVTVNNPNPISLSDDQDLGFDRYNAVLYVPAGCRDAYANANYWKDFKEIVEIDTDISQLDNAIYIEPFTARVGEDVRMSINLKNAEAATAYVFDLVLPEGITVATNDKGKYIDELSDRHDDHTRTINFKGENTYSFSTLSGNSEELTGNDGPIRLVTLHVDDAVEEGVYPILIKNASYSKPNGALVVLAATKSSVTIEDYVLGDVNGNGGVDIGDAVSIVNYLVGKDSSNFVAKAADTNKNEQIDIGDAVTIVNLLVGKITSLTRELNINWDDKNPE